MLRATNAPFLPFTDSAGLSTPSANLSNKFEKGWDQENTGTASPVRRLHGDNQGHGSRNDRLSNRSQS